MREGREHTALATTNAIDLRAATASVATSSGLCTTIGETITARSTLNSTARLRTRAASTALKKQNNHTLSLRAATLSWPTANNAERQSREQQAEPFSAPQLTPRMRPCPTPHGEAFAPFALHPPLEAAAPIKL